MSSHKNAKRILLATLLVGAVGCTSPGSTDVINPLAARTPDASSGVSASFSDHEGVAGSNSEESWLAPIKKAADGARGQAGTVGLVVKSAYGKAKSAVASVFMSENEFGEEVSENDVLSLANATPDLGPEVYVANGQLWETNGDPDKAMQQYARALEAEPDNAAALASVARLYNKQGKMEEAIEYFGKAIESEPSDPGLYNDLGMVLSQMGRHEEATAQLQKAIAIAPKTKRYANNLAKVLMEAGRTDEVFAVLSRAHEPAKAHYNMAYLHYQHQHLDNTQHHLEQALALDPSLEPARELLARLGNSQIGTNVQKTYETATAVAKNSTLQAVLQTVESHLVSDANVESAAPTEATATLSDVVPESTGRATEPEVRVAERPRDQRAMTPPSLSGPSAVQSATEATTEPAANLQIPPSFAIPPAE